MMLEDVFWVQWTLFVVVCCCCCEEDGYWKRVVCVGVRWRCFEDVETSAGGARWGAGGMG